VVKQPSQHHGIIIPSASHPFGSMASLQQEKNIAIRYYLTFKQHKASLIGCQGSILVDQDQVMLQLLAAQRVPAGRVMARGGLSRLSLCVSDTPNPLDRSRQLHPGVSSMSSSSSRPPLPPFTEATAKQKVQMAEDAWNTR
jgi:hypothetical protein